MVLNIRRKVSPSGAPTGADANTKTFMLEKLVKVFDGKSPAGMGEHLKQVPLGSLNKLYLAGQAFAEQHKNIAITDQDFSFAMMSVILRDDSLKGVLFGDGSADAQPVPTLAELGESTTTTESRAAPVFGPEVMASSLDTFNVNVFNTTLTAFIKNPSNIEQLQYLEAFKSFPTGKEISLDTVLALKTSVADNTALSHAKYRYAGLVCLSYLRREDGVIKLPLTTASIGTWEFSPNFTQTR